MLKKMRLRWRVWRRYFNLQPLWLRLIIFASAAILIVASSLSFFFTGPGNPLLPPAWRARLAAAKLAQSIAGPEICHEDCENRRDQWRDMILKDGDQALYRALDAAVSAKDEPPAWRAEALALLAKAPSEKQPADPSWPAALADADNFNPELAAAAWRLFPEFRTGMASLVQTVVNSTVGEELRVSALRILPSSPEAISASWYWSLVESDESDKIKVLALRALSNFKDKTEIFGDDFPKLVKSLWHESSFPIYCRRFLVMLIANYASFDKTGAQALSEDLFSDQATDPISKVFLGENLNRYFGEKLAIPDLEPKAWEDYNQSDPLAAPFNDSRIEAE